MSVRTRFAPSPTGRLHLGNVRTAVFNWLFARHHGGELVLRIEDTDLERNVDGAEQGVIEDLRWLGIDWDEGPDVGGPCGPYRQSERGDIHAAYARQLWISGQAYPCFATEEGAMGQDRRYSGVYRDLDPSEAQRRVAEGEPHVFRLRTPLDGRVEVTDEIRGVITFPASDIDDFILVRSDGRPTYNFGVVVDDLLMGITHVIRGAGHLSNTPRQLLIWQAFEAAPPTFAHLPDVLSPDGGKLSKRSGAAAVADLREAGVLPEAVVNYLSLLGWSHPDEQEIFTPDELIRAVDLDRVGASDTAFDPDKMRWVAQQQMSRLDDAAFLDGALPVLATAGLETPASGWVAGALRSRLASFGEIRDHLAFLQISDVDRVARFRVGLEEEGEADDPHPLLLAADAAIRALEAWDPESVKGAIVRAGASAAKRGRGLYVPLRLAWTGEAHGPDLAALVASLGYDEAVRRLATLS